jgi:hypothetical protein
MPAPRKIEGEATSAKGTTMPEFDGVWKEALAALFRHLLRLHRPAEAEQVDWQKGVDALETEIQKMLPASQIGVKRIDKLFKVYLHNGEVRYYHVEVQCWYDSNFEHRVYIYNSVAELFCGDPVDSLIILGDDDPHWLPGSYAWARSCSRKSFTFEPLKLLRWRGKEEELFSSDNPFALFILAHNQVWATEGNDKARAERKLRLLVRGCSLKMSVEYEIDRPVLLRLIDWLLPLPAERNDPIWMQVREFQEGQTMPFVSWFEQQIEKSGERGEIRGLHQGITSVLKVRFGADGEALAAEARKQTTPDWLRQFLAASETGSLDDLRKLLP